MIDAFHFLRPLWLLLLIPTALLGYRLWRQQRDGSGWQRLIPAALLQPLLEQTPGTQRRTPLLALGGAWLLAIVALAGPTWAKLPQPLFQPQAALVVILDLSPSMQAQDLKPSRLVQARLRLIDLLRERREGLTALLVYAGDAHVVTPLSHDRQTLLALVPTLSPSIMPLRGSQVEDAVAQALALLDAGNHRDGQLLLISDGVTPAAADAVRAQLQASDHRLSVLGVGTDEGAPIPLNDGSFASDRNGAMVLARLDSPTLRQLARDGGGLYRDLSPSGDEVAALLAQFRQSAINRALDQPQSLGQPFDRWREMGPWLVLLLLPVAALAFRRGWLLSLLLTTSLLSSVTPRSAHAADPPPPAAAQPAPESGWKAAWQALWQTPDQQARQQYETGAYERAAEQFQNPAWQGSARYRAGDYAGASEQFDQALALEDNAANHYNRANALAKSGQLQPALDAYDQALQRDPRLEDARVNRQIVEQLLKQQQEQEQEQEQEQPQGSEQPNDQTSPGDSSAQNNPPQQPAAGNGSEGNAEDSEPPASAGENRNDQEPKQDQEQSTDPMESGQAENRTQPSAEQSSNASPSGDSEADSPPASAQPQQAELDDSNEPPPRSEELERWLRQLPDDPGGLLKRKFEYQYRQKLEAYRQGRWTPPEENRW